MMASTCLRICRGLPQQLRTCVRRNYCGAVGTSQRGYSTETGEKATAKPDSAYSDIEQKLAGEIELLNKDLKNFKEKCSELEDKYKRSLAESENLRRRLTKQIEDAKIFGIQGFCKDLLTVADILHQATESVPADQVEKNSHLKGLFEGLKMTEAELHKVFRRHGLAQVNPIDEKFDPNQHEALFEQPIEGKTPGSVIVVTKVGYKLHERIIRPALVGVAK